MLFMMRKGITPTQEDPEIEMVGAFQHVKRQTVQSPNGVSGGLFYPHSQQRDWAVSLSSRITVHHRPK
jgi:hypothetical protein